MVKLSDYDQTANYGEGSRQWRIDRGLPATCAIDLRAMAYIEKLEEALGGFTASYRRIYNVDRIYPVSYEEHCEDERLFRNAYEKAKAALQGEKGTK